MEAPDETETTPDPSPSEPAEPTSRLLSSAALGLVGLSALELIGAFTIGLSVDSAKLNFITKLGYGYLTQLDKSPVGIVLVVASVMAAVALLRPSVDTRSRQMASLTSWVVIASAGVLAVGAILGVLARFKVAQLSATQAIDPLTRRVLVVFVIRNFGSAMLAMLVSVGSVAGRRSEPTPVA